jgi:hypothetical protein
MHIFDLLHDLPWNAEFPKAQKRTNGFFFILKPIQISPGNAPFTHTWHDVG